MTVYQVTIDLNSLSYSVEATTVEKAVEEAMQLASKESNYDLLKSCNVICDIITKTEGEK